MENETNFVISHSIFTLRFFVKKNHSIVYEITKSGQHETLRRPSGTHMYLEM